MLDTSTPALAPLEGVDRLNALADAAGLITAGLAGRELADRLVELCGRLFGADAVALWRQDARERHWRIVAARNLSESYCEVTLPDSTGGRSSSARLLRAPFVVADAERWDAVPDRARLYHDEGVRMLLVLPLYIRNEASGTLCCYYRSERGISEEELALARTYASIASSALSAQKLERLAQVTQTISAELELERLVQAVTDAATELTGAQFGAFFYNVVNSAGGSYMLYTISGAPREAFSKFPMPRNTAVFAPTFAGSGTVRSDNILKDPRYGHNAPHYGMPPGHLPVVSYLAVPVISRSGEPIGGLFFGHPEEGVFTEAEERIAEALAAQAAIGIDNARLYRSVQEDQARAARDEARYRALVAATPTRQAIGIASPEGLIATDSPSWRDLTGQTFEEMQGRGWLTAIHAEDRPRVEQAWDAAIRSGEVFRERLRLLTRDRGSRWFEAKSVPVRDAGGTIVEWVSTVTDVHDAKLAEDMLQFLAQATELFSTSLDYEETLRTVTALAVPEIADWCAVDIADEAAPYRRLAVAHVDPTKVKLVEDLARRYPPDSSGDAIGRVIRTGEPELVPVIPDGILEARARDEEHLRLLRSLGIVSWMIVPLRSRGRVLGAVTFVTAESERHYTQDDLARAQEFARRASVAIDNARLYREAQAANRAKDEFLATLSHELRTPMTAVLGWARLLNMGLGEAEAREAVDAIARAAEVQAQLIDDILDMSRIMAGKLRIDPEPNDIRTVVHAALATVHPAADAKGIEILTSFAPALPPIAGDEGRLQQVVWNLLSNAIKFTSKGGTVTVRLSTQGSLLRLTVQDTGQGIPREFLPHVFEPFRQADSSTTRSHGGIGLGLAIVRYIVEMHGGRVRVESGGAGKGATFTVELPVLESPPLVAPDRSFGVGALAAPAAPQLPRLDGLRVLAIDDQVYTRDVVTAVLRRCGAEVIAAASAREGIEAAWAKRPDIVVCDIAMPHEDGYTFLRELRASPDATTAGTPVIALTAFGRAEDREIALASGFTDYLKKPVEPFDLAASVARLSQQRGRRE